MGGRGGKNPSGLGAQPKRSAKLTVSKKENVEPKGFSAKAPATKNMGGASQTTQTSSYRGPHEVNHNTQDLLRAARSRRGY